MGADEASAFESATVYSLNPLPRFLGKKFGRDFKSDPAALRDGEQDFVRPFAESLLAGDDITLELNGSRFEIRNEECEVKSRWNRRPAPIEDNGYVVVLDMQLTSDLVEEGWRERSSAASRICARRRISRWTIVLR